MVALRRLRQVRADRQPVRFAHTPLLPVGTPAVSRLLVTYLHHTVARPLVTDRMSGSHTHPLGRNSLVLDLVHCRR